VRFLPVLRHDDIVTRLLRHFLDGKFEKRAPFPSEVLVDEVRVRPLSEVVDLNL